MKSPLALVSLLFATLATALCGTALAAEGAAAKKADLAKGQDLSTQVCAACHTADGSRGSPANPILQGQHPEYLAKQLGEFKSGKRNNPVMKGFAATLSEADMLNVSTYYAGKQAKPGFAKQKDLVKLGEKIYRAGIADKAVPACSGCHGPAGSGMPAQYPRVAGQHADYAEAQMLAFRGGQRANGPKMVAIAARMSDREIKAVSDYMAGLR